MVPIFGNGPWKKMSSVSLAHTVEIARTGGYDVQLAAVQELGPFAAGEWKVEKKKHKAPFAMLLGTFKPTLKHK